MESNFDSIIRFWFGASSDDAKVAIGQSHLWWSKDAAVDAEIRGRFAFCFEQAAARELDAWEGTPRGRLALILLTDQFPRNIYRGTPKAFVFDSLARDWCKQGIADSSHRLLRPIERAFFYLPLQHSESLDDQQQSVFLCEELALGVATEERPTFDEFLVFAVRHRDIIARFGRFPHRNSILGRESTSEEIQFLAQAGSSF